jgi:hypothetical protein
MAAVWLSTPVGGEELNGPLEFYEAGRSRLIDVRQICSASRADRDDAGVIAISAATLALARCKTPSERGSVRSESVTQGNRQTGVPSYVTCLV